MDESQLLFDETISSDGDIELSECVDKLLKQNARLVNDVRKLWGKVHEFSGTIQTLQQEKDQLVLEVNELNSYNRRSNIEIRNIPESVKDRDLENYCIDVLSRLEIFVASYDIVGCHRLGKFFHGKNRSVIIRFVNRKDAYAAIYYQRDLKHTEYKNLFITENLCPTHRRIFGKLYKAKKAKQIDSVWTHHGIVYAKMEENGEGFRIPSIDKAQLFVHTSSCLRNKPDDTKVSGSTEVKKDEPVSNNKNLPTKINTEVKSKDVVEKHDVVVNGSKDKEVDATESTGDASAEDVVVDNEDGDAKKVDNMERSKSTDELLLSVITRVVENGIYQGSSSAASD